MGVTMTKWEGPIFTGEKDFKGSLAIDVNLGGEKVTNGSFTGNADGWTLGAAWAYNANAVDKNADGTTTLSQDVSAVANDIYRVEYVVSAWSVGTVTVAVGGVSGTARGANGTYVEYITATGTGSLTFTPTNTARFTLDTISVKRVGAVAADRVNLWAGDRIAAGVEAAGDAGLFFRSEDGSTSFIGDRWALGAQDFYGRNTQILELNVSADEGGAALNTWSATAAQAAMLDLNRSKSATIGTHAVVASADALGFLTFRGSDGTAFIEAAQIRAEVDGTPGTNDMPGRLVFFTTADGAASVTERMRIDNAGRVMIGGSATGGAQLSVGRIDTTWNTYGFYTGSSHADSDTFSADFVQEYVRNDANGVSHIFYRTRGTAFGTKTALSADDEIGTISFQGFTDARKTAASIAAYADTGWGATGNDAPGRIVISTCVDGTATLSERWRVDNYGVQSFTMHDNTATPVAATAALKMFAHNKSVADDGIITLPAVTTCGFGVVMCDTDVSERTQFWVDSTGTVTLINNAGSVVANADTDTNLCIGTAATQEPLQVKNRLGATKVVNVIFWYD